MSLAKTCSNEIVLNIHIHNETAKLISNVSDLGSHMTLIFIGGSKQTVYHILMNMNHSDKFFVMSLNQDQKQLALFSDITITTISSKFFSSFFFGGGGGGGAFLHL